MADISIQNACKLTAKSYQSRLHCECKLTDRIQRLLSANYQIRYERVFFRHSIGLAR